VHQLVIHQRRHALIRRHRFEREVQRRDLERHHIARHSPGSGIAGIREVDQQNADRIERFELELPAGEVERVEEGASGVGTR
jgi:hypothetical protein